MFYAVSLAVMPVQMIASLTVCCVSRQTSVSARLPHSELHLKGRYRSSSIGIRRRSFTRFVEDA